MPLIPANALQKELTWNDFERLDEPPDDAPSKDMSAYTKVDFAHDGSWGEPQPTGKFKLTRLPKVEVKLSPMMWALNEIDTWKPSDQKALLDHEQLHYLISVLAARDCVKAFEDNKDTEFASAAAMTKFSDDLLADLTTKKIQVKYDKDTEHEPLTHATIQARWADAITKCKITGSALRPTLKSAGLFP